jgi:hypothetical protein
LSAENDAKLHGEMCTSKAGCIIGKILKDKLQHLAGQQSGFLDSLSLTVKDRVSTLQELQSKHDELEAKFFEERAALEA